MPRVLFCCTSRRPGCSQSMYYTKLSRQGVFHLRNQRREHKHRTIVANRATPTELLNCGTAKLRNCAACHGLRVTMSETLRWRSRAGRTAKTKFARDFSSCSWSHIGPSTRSKCASEDSLDRPFAIFLPTTLSKQQRRAMSRNTVRCRAAKTSFHRPS